MRGAAPLLAVVATGCSRLLGFDSPTLADPDAAVADTMSDTADGPLPDVALQPVTITFRRGVDGYNSVRDTYIESGSPNGSNGNDSLLRARASDRFALLAFDDIFGATAIPPGAPIMEAHLEINCQNPGMVDGFLVLHPWGEPVTFNTFGATAGVSAEDIGAQAITIPNMSGVLTLDVTSSLEAWSADPSTNQGWAFIDGGGGGETVFQSSENSTKPLLSVTFLASP